MEDVDETPVGQGRQLFDAHGGHLSGQPPCRRVRSRGAAAAPHRGRADGASDLIWSGQAMSPETVMSWELSRCALADESSPLTVRDATERYDGEIWLERRREVPTSTTTPPPLLFRILLPTAAPQQVGGERSRDLSARREPTHEYYNDFRSVRLRKGHMRLTTARLTEPTFTIFDETTGLNLRKATRSSRSANAHRHGKLRRSESFIACRSRRRLCPRICADPRYHRGDAGCQPKIGEVLPFHAFAADYGAGGTQRRRVRHAIPCNSKEAATGPFDQPVLDNLLLRQSSIPTRSRIASRPSPSAWVHIIGRHTALGDDRHRRGVPEDHPAVCGEGYLHHAREAREAAETYYARNQVLNAMATDSRASGLLVRTIDDRVYPGRAVQILSV